MSTIRMFYGILVSICFEQSERHHTPHIQDELFAAWDLARNGEQPFCVAPLQ